MDVVLDDPCASRVHATIFRAEEGYVIEDMGSSNGTYVNDRRVTRTRLREGDRVQIGTRTWEVRLAE